MIKLKTVECNGHSAVSETELIQHDEDDHSMHAHDAIRLDFVVLNEEFNEVSFE